MKEIGSVVYLGGLVWGVVVSVGASIRPVGDGGGRAHHHRPPSRSINYDVRSIIAITISFMMISRPFSLLSRPFSRSLVQHILFTGVIVHTNKIRLENFQYSAYN